ncbi:DUF4202 family protein, partial [Nanoarchaeota archaeon]
ATHCPDKALEKDIAKEISNSDHPEDPKHSLLTKKWLLILDPDAPYHVQIAALAHDIDRARNSIKWNPDLESYNSYKKKHEKRSAQIINEILKQHKYPWLFRRKVIKIIRNHEYGGYHQANLVRDADSLSFFENNIKYMLKRHPDDYIIKKCRWMYDRMAPKSRQLVTTIKFPPKIKKLLKEVF